MQVSDTVLYTQLTFYEYIFDVNHHLKKLADGPSGTHAGHWLLAASLGFNSSTVLLDTLTF